MTSIRRTLMVSLSSLVVVALTAASWQVYRTASSSLQAEQLTNRQLLSARYDDQVREEHHRFDNDLLAQAKAVANSAQSQFSWQRLQYAQLYAPVGLLTATLAPQGHVLLPVWAGETGRTPLSFAIQRRVATELQFDESLFPRDPDGTINEYFQVNTEWGQVWRSRALGDSSLPFDAKLLADSRVIDWVFDDVHLSPGDSVRRVQLKTPMSGVQFFRQPRPTPNPAPTPFVGPPTPPEIARTNRPPYRVAASSSPWIVVHCASQTAPRDAAVARFARLRDQEMGALNDAGLAQLASLRQRLAGIGLATLLLTLLAGTFLIRLGLKPMERVSEAVRQVSPKDFKLPLDDAGLPRELTPITHRLRETLDQLKRAFEREKQAAADISHELRTPVAALLTTLDVALRKPRSAEEYRQTLTECRSVGGRLRDLVEQILALARLDAGAARVRPTTVDLNELAQDCAQLVRPLADDKSLQLSVQTNGPLPWATDEGKLREILVNLLHNAVEYNQPGGTISVAVSADNGWADLSVSDTGHGIDPQLKDRVFERFFRGDPSRGAEELHAGLGLSIVKGYVELLGGRIGLESELGRGTTFHVRLPRMNANDPAGRTAA